MEKSFEEIYSQEITLPEALAGRVAVVSCMAYSNMQRVYLVRDIKNRPFVLKVAKGSKRRMLKKDAAVLREHAFSFLPEYEEYLEAEDTGYLLREYIEGDTLWEWVNKRGVFSAQEAREILCRLCDMVGQFHQQKPPVIHRDIKPQNIVITKEKNLFLIDMGTVREYKEDTRQDTVFVGTKPTAAPEQYGYRQTDGRADIYALGVLYLFLLTGSLDVQCPKNWELLDRSACSVILKCTKMDPDDRYQSCAELKKAVRATGGHRRRREFFKKWQPLLKAAWMLMGSGVIFFAGVCRKRTKSALGNDTIKSE
ncbi:kinase domain family protein [Marvinbryantia formatexigens DSM 14469]|uniref:non-specific serine/threonine protein kinase n=1 Tax=Marvinbryantia formatexigens DSM 14469 TaxID=478749 RepID=C6LBW9_9FIRM|nr:protein kinase [Marvinbryantia formatexigens]EET61922.1 kinase domain family protein [Marvinbryantia formatexigens DSM 14469]UWO25735.1 protein kinase [Marvinbryantia formatexigens DSM 14469]SDF34959.1 Serine/threonine protein kinase [Marvinbryantia formatexigens]